MNAVLVIILGVVFLCVGLRFKESDMQPSSVWLAISLTLFFCGTFFIAVGIVAIVLQVAEWLSK